MGSEPGLRGHRRAGGCGVAGRGASLGVLAGSGRPERPPGRRGACHLPGWMTPQLVASPPPPPGCHRPLTPRAVEGGRSAAARERSSRLAAGAGGSGAARA